MLFGIKQRVKIQPGGIIEIKSDELPDGSNAEVIVIVDENDNHNISFSNIIGSGKGCYKSAEEADLFIRKERDKWI